MSEARTLVIACLPDSYNRNPDRPDLGKFPLNTSIFDTLVRLNEDLCAEPMLATEWAAHGERSAVRFHLRRGVRFHTGQELTAEDVKYALDLTVRGSPHNHLQLGPDSVRIVDRYVVDVLPVRHNANLAEQLVHPIWGINRKGSDPLQPVGTGPYRFAGYTKGDRLLVERFDGCWNRADGGRPDRIIFRFASSSRSRVSMLLDGDADLVMDVPRELASELSHRAGIHVVCSTVGAYNALSFNIAGIPPHDLPADRLLRRAIASAIDRKAVLETAWAGNAVESPTWIPPPVLGPHASLVKGPRYDPAGAATLLEHGGWKVGRDGIRVRDGRRLTLLHALGGPGDSDPRDSLRAAEVIRDQLRQVGVETTIDAPQHSPLDMGRYDLYQGVANQNEAYAARLPDILYHSKGGPSAAFRAPGGKTDEAIERCRVAATSDEVRRYAAEAAHQLIDVEHVIVPLISVYRIWAMTGRVRRFVPHPSLTNQRWESVRL